MDFEFYSQTDTGRVRTNNEDSVALDALRGVAVLADGMGGYAAGEVASGMACDFIQAELGRWLQEASSNASDGDVKRAMDICVDNANRAIFSAANSNPTYAGMGTTLVLAVFRSGRLLLGHIGDSRAYRLRTGQLQQITKDHSLLQEQIDAGILTPEEAQFAAHKNLVTRALGVEDLVLMETHLHDVQSADIYLMCSDGLSDMLSDAQIAEVMVAHASLPEMGAALVTAANDAGGRDNIAVVLVRAQGVAEPAPKSWWPFRAAGWHELNAVDGFIPERFRMGKLVVSLDGVVIKEVQVTKDKTSLGRRPYNDIVIDNLAVSGEHAVLQLVGSDVFIEDLNSTNGTYINGKAVKKQLLQHNDTIEIGKYKIKYLVEEGSDYERTMIMRPGTPAAAALASVQAATAGASPTPAAAMGLGGVAASSAPLSGFGGLAPQSPASIKVLNGAAAGREVALTKVVTTVGKPGVQVASITKRPGGYVFAHVEGPARPTVNGKAVEGDPVHLKSGDVIELAGTQMQFVQV